MMLIRFKQDKDNTEGFLNLNQIVTILPDKNVHSKSTWLIEFSTGNSIGIDDQEKERILEEFKKNASPRSKSDS